MTITSTHASKIHTRCQKSQYAQPAKMPWNDFCDRLQVHRGFNSNYYYSLLYVWADKTFTTFSSDDTLKLRKKMEAAGITIS